MAMTEQEVFDELCYGLLRKENLSKKELDEMKDLISSLVRSRLGRQLLSEKICTNERYLHRLEVFKIVLETVQTLLPQSLPEEADGYLALIAGVAQHGKRNENFKWLAIRFLFEKNETRAKAIFFDALQKLLGEKKFIELYKECAMPYLGNDGGRRFLQTVFSTTTANTNTKYKISLLLDALPTTASQNVDTTHMDKENIAPFPNHADLALPNPVTPTHQLNSCLHKPTALDPVHEKPLTNGSPMQISEWMETGIQIVKKTMLDKKQIEDNFAKCQAELAKYQRELSKCQEELTIEKKELERQLSSKNRELETVRSEKEALQKKLDTNRLALETEQLEKEPLRTKLNLLQEEIHKIKLRAKQDVDMAEKDARHAVATFRAGLWPKLRPYLGEAIDMSISDQEGPQEKQILLGHLRGILQVLRDIGIYSTNNE
jgi:hypothetical protein